MSWLSHLGHLIGLALLAALVAGLYLYWPWPLHVIELSAPDFYKAEIESRLRDFQGLIAYLFPFLILSVIHTIWSWFARLAALLSSWWPGSSNRDQDSEMT